MGLIVSFSDDSILGDQTAACLPGHGSLGLYFTFAGLIRPKHMKKCKKWEKNIQALSAAASAQMFNLLMAGMLKSYQ